MEEVTNYHSRQSELVHPDSLSVPITIIGAGSIGSWVALALTKMGASGVTIMDGDSIEPHNLGSQVYGISGIGVNKTTDLAEAIKALSPTPLREAIPHHWTSEDRPDAGIVISAVDSMQVRAELFNSLINTKNTFIDGRMAANEINLYIVNMMDKEAMTKYNDTLFTDAEARDIPCSQRSVMYNAMTCGGLIASLVARVVNEEPVRFETIVDLYNMTMD